MAKWRFSRFQLDGVPRFPLLQPCCIYPFIQECPPNVTKILNPYEGFAISNFSGAWFSHLCKRTVRPSLSLNVGLGGILESWQHLRATEATPAPRRHDLAPTEGRHPFLYQLRRDRRPVRKNELEGRRGKQKDGSARTREAKLGCVFTQVGLD